LFSRLLADRQKAQQEAGDHADDKHEDEPDEGPAGDLVRVA